MGWFSKKVEIEIRGDDGQLKKVKVTKEEFDRWIAEGKVGVLGPQCKVHILDPKGDRTEMWAVGKDIPKEEYDRLKDNKGDLFVLVVWEAGKPSVNVISKAIWMQAKKAMEDI